MAPYRDLMWNCDTSSDMYGSAPEKCCLGLDRSMCCRNNCPIMSCFFTAIFLSGICPCSSSYCTGPPGWSWCRSLRWSPGTENALQGRRRKFTGIGDSSCTLWFHTLLRWIMLLQGGSHLTAFGWSMQACTVGGSQHFEKPWTSLCRFDCTKAESWRSWGARAVCDRFGLHRLSQCVAIYQHVGCTARFQKWNFGLCPSRCSRSTCQVRSGNWTRRRSGSCRTLEQRRWGWTAKSRSGKECIDLLKGGCCWSFARPFKSQESWREVCYLWHSDFSWEMDLEYSRNSQPAHLMPMRK